MTQKLYLSPSARQPRWSECEKEFLLSNPRMEVNCHRRVYGALPAELAPNTQQNHLLSFVP
jgi:hypothetical protein